MNRRKFWFHAEEFVVLVDPQRFKSKMSFIKLFKRARNTVQPYPDISTKFYIPGIESARADLDLVGTLLTRTGVFEMRALLHIKLYTE